MMVSVESGKVYLVNTARKGTFFIRVVSQSDEWIDGEIVAGATKAMLDYNVKEKGETVTLRRSFIYSATPQPVGI